MSFPLRLAGLIRVFLIVSGLGLAVGLVLGEGQFFFDSFKTIGDHITEINHDYAAIIRALVRISGTVIIFGLGVVLLFAGITIKSSNETWVAQDLVDTLQLILKIVRLLVILFITQDLIFVLIQNEAPSFALRPMAGSSILASFIALLIDFILLVSILLLSGFLKQTKLESD